VRIDAKVQLADGRDVRSLHGVKASVTPSVLSNAIAGPSDAHGSSAGSGTPDDVGASQPPPVGGALGRPQSSNAAAGIAQAIAQRVLPSATLSVSGKICAAQLTVTPVGIGLAGGCSPENAGTRPMRIVSGRILSEGGL
jgi:hypothetical protein